MLGEPVAPVSPGLDVPRKIYGARDGAAGGLSGAHADQIQDGDCEIILHIRLDEIGGERTQARTRAGL
jgi:hypothetical protein